MDGQKLASIALILVIVVSMAITPVKWARAAVYVPTKLYTERQVYTGTIQNIPITMTNTPTQGDSLVMAALLFVSGAAAGTISSITQAGVTWTQVVAGSGGSNYAQDSIWLGIVGAGVSKDITIATSASKAYKAVFNINEYAAVLTVGQYKAADNQASSSTHVTGTLDATPGRQSILIGMTVLAYNNAQSSPTNGFTLIDGAAYASVCNSAMLEKIYDNGGSTESTVTAGGSGVGCGLMASFIITSTVSTTYKYNLRCIYEDGTALASQAITVIDSGGSASLTIISAAKDYFFTLAPTSFTWAVGVYSRSIAIYSGAPTTYIITQPPSGGTSHPYLWSIKDLSGLLYLGGYLKLTRIISAVTTTTELEHFIDTVNGIASTLNDGGVYHIKILDSTGTEIYDYGDFLATTAQLNPIITLKTITFSQSAQVSYRYIVAEATRPVATQIVSNYNDTHGDTTNIALTIRYLNGTTAYSTSSASNAVSFNWSGAHAAADYVVQMVGTSSVFGSVSYFKTLPQAGAAYSAPLDLGLFGSTGTAGLTANALPFMLTLAVFACFSVATLGAGAVMGVGTAAILKAIGWWNPDSALLVFAFCLAVILALAEARRWNR